MKKLIYFFEENRERTLKILAYTAAKLYNVKEFARNYLF